MTIELAVLAAAASAPRSQRVVIAVMAAGIGLVAAVLVRHASSVPLSLLDGGLVVGNTAVCLIGAEQAAIGAAAPYLLVSTTLVAFGLRPLRMTVLHVGVAAGSYAALLVLGPSQPAAIARWVSVVAAVITSGLLLQWLVKQVRAIVAADLEAQREAAQVSSALTAVNDAKSAFLARMSHELRTPLNAVLGFAGVLGEGLAGPLGERQRGYVEDIEDAGRQLLTLVDEVLDLSEVEQGGVELEVEGFDFRDVIDESLRLVRHRAASGGVRLRLDVAIDETGVSADRHKIRQVIVNLLTNAVRFTGPGGHVTVRVDGDADRVRVAVWDTGVGIAEHDLERIFAEYEQAGDRSDGTGLGLPLARRFVEAHGGSLTAASSLGRGSIFSFDVPRRKIVTGAPEAAVASSEANDATFDAFTAPGSLANRAVIAQMGMWFSIGAGMFGPVIALLIPGGWRPKLMAIAVCLGAVASVPLQRRLSESAPRSSVEVMGTAGIVIISVIAVLDTPLADLVPLLYVWIVATSFAIWSARRGVEQLVAIGIAYGCVLAFGPQQSLATVRWVAVMASLCIVGGIIHWVTTHLRRTLVAEREARLRIEAAGARLADATRHKSAFLASMSHELRAPLNAVIGFSDVLLELNRATLNERQAEYVQEIADAGRHLLALITDILDLAKLEAGQLRLEYGPVSLPAIVQAAVSRLSDDAGRGGVHIATDVSPDMPVVVADGVRLEQMLVKLVSNAVRFSPTGSLVSIAAAIVDGGLHLRVHDSRAGIASSDQTAIFEAFHDSADSATDGVGVGLALAKGLVELHGGVVDLRSSADGTEFIVRLPAETLLDAAP